MQKGVYKLRAEDFIPIVGLKKHLDRCIYESWRHRPCTKESEDYRVRCIGREYLLAKVTFVNFLDAPFE